MRHRPQATLCAAGIAAPLIKDAHRPIGADGAKHVAPPRGEGDIEHLLVVRDELYNRLLGLHAAGTGTCDGSGLAEARAMAPALRPTSMSHSEQVVSMLEVTRRFWSLRFQSNAVSGAQ